MKDKNPKQEWHLMLFNAFSLIAIGLSVGWLMGLSVTPGVTSSILTSLMTVVVLLITVVSGLEKTTPDNEPQKWRVSPIPIALFMVSLVVGSSLGVYARTHNWLGVDVPPVASSPTGSEKGSSAPVVAQSTPVVTMGALFSGEFDKCKALLDYDDDDLPRKLKFSSIKIFRGLPEVVTDVKLLRQVVEIQCATYQKGEK